MSVKLERCPEPNSLSEYVLGLLPPDQSEILQAHIEECAPCVETITGLEIQDTMHDLAINANPKRDLTCELARTGDASVVENLIHRIRQMPDSGGTEFGGRRSSIDQDRAAEVIRLLDPIHATDPSQNLGRLESYQLETILGTGSSGIVFQAVDERLGRPVAVKVLRPSLGVAARERFIAEARATATLNHPNVIGIYQVGTGGVDDSLAYIAMELLPGETLEQRLNRESILSIDKVKDMGRQIAEGLAAAHQHGLIHRDIKPANLWIVDQDDQVKILDFGLVRITDEDPQLTCTGMIAGTPCYMSPEQSRGDELDARSDLFSVGCVMYQSLTAKLPFESTNALATLQSIQRDQPTAPAMLDHEIPSDVSDLTMALLEKSPNKRPPSASDVAFALSNDRGTWPFNVKTYQTLKPEKVATKKPAATTATSSSSISWGGVFATFVLIGAVSWGAFMFAPQIIRIATNQGELLIKTDDPDVQIEILSNGERVQIVDLKTQQSLSIAAGNYEIRPLGDRNSVLIDQGKVVLSRGEKVIVTLTKIESTGDLKESSFDGDLKEGLLPSPEGLLPLATIDVSDVRAARASVNATSAVGLREQLVRLEADLEIAKLEKEEYLQGDFFEKKLELETEIAGLNTNLNEMAEFLERDDLTESSRQPALRAQKQKRLQLEKAEREKRVLEKLTHPKKLLGFDTRINTLESSIAERKQATQTNDPRAQNNVMDPDAQRGTASNGGVDANKLSDLDEQIEHVKKLVERKFIKKSELVKLQRQREQLVNPEPVYQGMTIGECLRIVRSERDMSLLCDPIKGLIHLSEDGDSDQFIEPILKVFRRSAYSGHRAETEEYFLTTRTEEQLERIFLSEFEQGTRNTWRMLQRNIEHSRRNNIGTTLEPRQQEVVKCLIKALPSKDAEKSKWAAMALSQIATCWNVSDDAKDSLTAALLSLVESETNEAVKEEAAMAIMEFAPDTVGLGKALGKSLDGGNWQAMLQRIQQLKPEIAGEASPAVAELTIKQMKRLTLLHAKTGTGLGGGPPRGLLDNSGAAIQTLLHMGKHAKPALKPFKQYLNEEEVPLDEAEALEDLIAELESLSVSANDRSEKADKPLRKKKR